VTGKLDAEAKPLLKLTDGALADEVGGLEARIAALKSEAIRRNLHRAEGEALRITLTPPGTSQRASMWGWFKPVDGLPLPCGERLCSSNV
jgi:hypothetical protein